MFAYGGRTFPISSHHHYLGLLFPVTPISQLSFQHTLAPHSSLILLAVIFGPAATKWYSFLANRVSLSTTNRTIAARVVADQFVFAPINMTCFLSSMAYFEGSSVKDKLSKAWVPGMTNNFLLWPWVQAANFKFVPLEHRVLVVNFVALGWNCYLSYLNSSGSSEKGTVDGIEKAEREIKKTV